MKKSFVLVGLIGTLFFTASAFAHEQLDCRFANKADEKTWPQLDKFHLSIESDSAQITMNGKTYAVERDYAFRSKKFKNTARYNSSSRKFKSIIVHRSLIDGNDGMIFMVMSAAGEEDRNYVKFFCVNEQSGS